MCSRANEPFRQLASDRRSDQCPPEMRARRAQGIRPDAPRGARWINSLKLGATMADDEHVEPIWVRKPATPFTAVVAALALTWLGVLPVHADPDGAVRVPEGGYLYAEDTPELTNATAGLTIEAWLWLTDVPPDNGYWPLIQKDGSYAIVVMGRDLTSPVVHPGQMLFNYLSRLPMSFHWRFIKNMCSLHKR